MQKGEKGEDTLSRETVTSFALYSRFLHAERNCRVSKCLIFYIYGENCWNLGGGEPHFLLGKRSLPVDLAAHRASRSHHDQSAWELQAFCQLGNPGDS